jgi:type IV secretion system protein VirD4
LTSKKASAGGTVEPAKAAAPAREKRAMPISEDEIEKAHNDRVSRLKEVVDREAEGKSPRKRKSLEELFAATVPDPIMEQAGR